MAVARGLEDVGLAEEDLGAVGEGDSGFRDGLQGASRVPAHVAPVLR